MNESRKLFYYCLKFKNCVVLDPTTYNKCLKARDKFISSELTLKKKDFKISRIRKSQYK